MDGSFYIQISMLLLIFTSDVFLLLKVNRSRTLLAYLVCMIFATIWCASRFSESVATFYYPSIYMTALAQKFAYVGMGGLAMAAIRFSWVSCGKFELYAKPKMSILLSALAGVLMLVSPIGLAQYGILSEALFLTSFSCCLVYTGITTVISRRRLNHKLTKYYIACSTSPIVAGLAYSFFVITRFDLSILCVSIQLLVIFILVYYHKVMNISPIATQTIIHELAYPLFVLSYSDTLLFSNKAAKLNMPLLELYSGKSEAISFGENVFFPALTHLHDGNKLLTFKDITARSVALKSLAEQRDSLNDMQNLLDEQVAALMGYTEVAAMYAAEKKRNKVMTKLEGEVCCSLLEVIENTRLALSEGTNPETIIEKNIALTVEGFTNVRTIINEFRARQ